MAFMYPHPMSTKSIVQRITDNVVPDYNGNMTTAELKELLDILQERAEAYEKVESSMSQAMRPR